MTSPAILLLLTLLVPLMLAADAPFLRQSAVLELPGRPGFGGMAVFGDTLLIAHGSEASVELFNLRTHRLAGRIREMSSPRGIAVDPGSQTAYVACFGSRTLVLVSTADWQVKASLRLPEAPENLLLDAQSRHLYLSFPEAREVGILDLTSPELVPGSAEAGRALSVATVAGRPAALAFDASRHELFVALAEPHAVAVLDAALKPLRTLPLNGAEPTALLAGGEGERLYVAVRYAVLAIQPDSGEELARAPAPAGITALGWQPGGHSLLAMAPGVVAHYPGSLAPGSGHELPIEVKGASFLCDSLSGAVYLAGGERGHARLLVLRPVR